MEMDDLLGCIHYIPCMGSLGYRLSGGKFDCLKKKPYLHSKQALFAMKRSPVWEANKACFENERKCL